jgi:hypothetical protein
MKKAALVVGLLLVAATMAGADSATVPMESGQVPVVAEGAAPAAPAVPVAPGTPVEPIALTTCYQNYQFCLNGCGGNATCRLNCWERYNACRYY